MNENFACLGDGVLFSDCKLSKAIFEFLLGISSLIVLFVSDTTHPILLTILIILSIICLLGALLIICIFYAIKRVSIPTKSKLKKSYGLFRSIIMVTAIIVGVSQGLK